MVDLEINFSRTEYLVTTKEISKIYEDIKEAVASKINMGISHLFTVLFT